MPLYPFYLLFCLSLYLMLSILSCQPIDYLVGTREEYWSTSSSYKEEKKERKRYKGGSIYRWEEAYKYRRLGSYNIASNITQLIYTGGSSVLPVLSCLSCHLMLSILPH